MTKIELITTIALRTGYDKTTISNVLESTIDIIKKEVADGGNVHMRGFGIFQPKVRAKKLARNISKNITIEVPEHHIPYFKPASEFCDLLRCSEEN